jgi:6-phospho-beta-glucosidase
MNLVILGGGSLNTPAFFAALSKEDQWLRRVCLVDKSAEYVEEVGEFCKAIALQFNLPLQITWETDLKNAVVDADVVLNMLRVGGLDALEEDQHQLAVSGAVGHATTYPQAIRNLPVTLEAAHVVEKVAPDALWVNFSNPVTILCEALALHSKLRCVGICYHSFTMRSDFADILGVDPMRARVEFFGLNHLGWVTDITVDGVSRMDQLIKAIKQQKNKRYNHWYTQIGLIPIDHAFCLYHKGDVWFNRQKGIRGSLLDIGIRLGLTKGDVARERRKRQELHEIINGGQPNNLDKFHSQAPWYPTCILPFLRAYASAQPHEFILTWNHGGNVLTLPGLTAESAVLIQGKQVQKASKASGLPEFASEWVRQVRASERLLIRAIVEHSRDLAAMAWAIHPNVASMIYAERLASFYFNKEV